MQRRRKILGRASAGAAVALCAAAWACGVGGSATELPPDVNLGPTFGMDVTVAVQGRGRVVSDPPILDCPSSCFGRVVLTDPRFDGSDRGVVLTPHATPGSHFTGWTYESTALGVRARGPSECSPMTRATSILPIPKGAVSLALHYGETAGTPPPGQEAACAEYTSVPLAYSLTANFEEDTLPAPAPTRPPPPVEVLFEPPMLGVVTSREIGVTGGRVYWRFERNGLSGVASGQADGKGGGSSVLLQPFDNIRRFRVDRHVIFQHGLENGGGYIRMIQSGTTTVSYVSYFGGQCASLAVDDTLAYCRYYPGAGSQTYLYAFTIPNGAGTGFALPPGGDLARDDDRLYFSEDHGAITGQAVVESAPRVLDAGYGVATITKLVPGQTAPRDLHVGPSSLYWLDDQGGNFTAANTAPKLGLDAGGLVVRALPGAKFLALDPSSDSTFYVVVAGSDLPGQSSIVKASTSSPTVASFRYGLTGIGGLAVDDTYVYWTQNDGRVYRAPKE